MWAVVFAWLTAFTLMFASFELDSWLSVLAFGLACWFFVAGFI